MAENTGEVKMTPTLGLTGLTMNAMALIAPGAFLWLTFAPQATEGATAPSMWIGIVFALLLCLATAVCYAEMAKLYPGTGSSYYFAEQSFLNHDTAWKYARLMKFIVGWGSHLYYWIYPGVMVAVTGVFCGYIIRDPVAKLHERGEPRAHVHDANRDLVFFRCRVYRAPRR
jgi:APA family basic amino acid/polyamine antiporter